MPLKKQCKKIDEVYQIFLKRVNINSELKEIDREYLIDEKKAFFNALWFYSEDFYFKKSS